MHKTRALSQFSPLSICAGTVAVLAISYIGLMAVVMNYAALTVEFSQSARNEEAAVANLEGKYLAAIATIDMTDYAAEGYMIPSKRTYIRAESATALR